MTNFISAKDAKDMADNSEKAYKALMSELYCNIRCKADEGKYKVRSEKKTTLRLALRACEELKSNGYSADFKWGKLSGYDRNDYTFDISWQYAPSTI